MPKGERLNFLLDLEEVGKKRCTFCRILKDKIAFGNTKSSKDGLMTNCKECRKIICDRYVENNQEKNKISRKRTYEKHKEKKLEYSKKIYRDKIEHYTELHRKIRATPENKEYKRNWIVNKYKNDPTYRLHVCFRAILKESLRKNGTRTFDMVPYTIQEYKQHLEKQFDENMCWGNYGSYWQVDHIIPRTKFKYTSYLDEDFKKCWALENLRPLEKGENSRKGGRTPEEYEQHKQNINKIMEKGK